MKLGGKNKRKSKTRDRRNFDRRDRPDFGGVGGGGDLKKSEKMRYL